MEQLPPTIHESWHSHIQPLFDDPKMVMIKNQVLPNCRFYPERHLIFRVFEMPINEIKVVILGQDVYPNGQGVGLAFAVNMASQPLPPSLRIIKNEVDINTELRWFTKRGEDYSWRTLEHWKKQGVFLLNSALTVEVQNAGSHLGIWQWFTREVVKVISINQPCIWMLWGSKAKGFKDYIDKNSIVPNIIDAITLEKGVQETFKGYNFVLSTDHPAAETYPDSKYKFTGCNHFNLSNEILKAKGLEQIKW